MRCLECAGNRQKFRGAVWRKEGLGKPELFVLLDINDHARSLLNLLLEFGLCEGSGFVG
jgi:hypothetical protein